MFSVALLLLLAAGCVKCEQLTQPASVTVQPGQRLTITCQVSYSVSDYYTAWIRQPAGKGLEWMSSDTNVKDSLKDKFSVNLDSSSNTVTLNGQNVQPEDSAVYFCARRDTVRDNKRRLMQKLVPLFTPLGIFMSQHAVLPHYHKHVNFATRGENTLDQVYTNIRQVFRAIPHPHLESSDHLSVMLIPAYRPLLTRSKPAVKQIRAWPEGATAAFQDCFESTEWSVFREAATTNQHINLTEYTDSVTITKDITIRANDKPWFTREVHELLRARNTAFKSGDKEALKSARANLHRCVRAAKRAYEQKINSHFTDTKDPRRLWQGIQSVTDYKPAPLLCEDNTDFLNSLNTFFSQFEDNNTTTPTKAPVSPDNITLQLDPADVRRTILKVNPRKAAGPDNIPVRVLRDCADSLTDVLTDIYNTSLSQATIPASFKATTVIPLPKKSPVSSLNDYRPIALTPIMMKCFERLVKAHITSTLPTTLDPYQFAYRPKRSTDDAIATALHLCLAHLENKNSHARMLFIDFSSAFNTVIPSTLHCATGCWTSSQTDRRQSESETTPQRPPS